MTRSTRSKLSAVVESAALLFAPAANAQTIHAHGNWNWTDMDPGQCAQRGAMAINAAGQAFNMPLQAQAHDGWYAYSTVGHTIAGVYCAADPQGSPQRVLVIVEVHSTQAGVTAPLRDFMQGCFYNDQCGDTTAGTGRSTSIRDRIAGLQGRISREEFARLYADLSVLIAQYGAQVGWVNGQDSTAPSNDRGRGIQDWNAHYQYGLGFPGGVANFIENRLATLRGSLPSDQYNRMEAQASQAIAQRGG